MSNISEESNWPWWIETWWMAIPFWILLITLFAVGVRILLVMFFGGEI